MAQLVKRALEVGAEAALTGLTTNGAWRLLGKISRVLPLAEDSPGGLDAHQWFIPQECLPGRRR